LRHVLQKYHVPEGRGKMTIASYCSELLLLSALRKMRAHDAETEPRLKC
jgi:hypothetical protein